jgi:hypothetical protein
MTSTFNLPKTGNKMADDVKPNRFIGAKVTKKVKFMGLDNLEITKLSISQVMKIQEQVKALEASQSEDDNLKLLACVIQSGAPELAGLPLEELYNFSMDELTSLSAEIMKYSGLGKEAAK